MAPSMVQKVGSLRGSDNTVCRLHSHGTRNNFIKNDLAAFEDDFSALGDSYRQFYKLETLAAMLYLTDL